MKIKEYGQITKLTDNGSDYFLVDTASGTKIITAKNLYYELAEVSKYTTGYEAAAAIHRTQYRGKNLGSSLTATQKAAIQNGTFDDMWIGDYWSIGGKTWRIADFDYWYHFGSPALATHHVVIVPDSIVSSAKMNSTSITTGGYVGSEMYETNMEASKTTIKEAFEGSIITHKEFLINATTNGYPSAGSWVDSEIELMNEPMVFGSYIYTPANNGTTDVKRFTSSNTQLALFRLNRYMINYNAASYWLRDVVSSTHFARVDGTGAATSSGAANSYGIRPVFAIG